MQMKTLLLILFLALGIGAQTTVPVTQGFVDDANAAFREVVVLRKANDALAEANKSKDVAVAALTQVNDLLRQDNSDLRKLKCDTASILFVIRWKRCK